MDASIKKGHFHASILQNVCKLTLLHSDTCLVLAAGLKLGLTLGLSTCALLISSSSALATQVPVKTSLVSGRPRQKQRYSPCQISLGVAGDRQERALAIANSEVLDGFKSSFK